MQRLVAPTQVLESVIKTRWGALPDAQREGIKTYISNLIIKYSTGGWKWGWFLCEGVGVGVLCAEACVCDVKRRGLRDLHLQPKKFWRASGGLKAHGCFAGWRTGSGSGLLAPWAWRSLELPAAGAAGSDAQHLQRRRRRQGSSGGGVNPSCAHVGSAGWRQRQLQSRGGAAK